MGIFRKLLLDRKGTAAIEYGLLASCIALTAVTAMADVGNQLSNTFDKVEAAMDTRDGLPLPLR